MDEQYNPQFMQDTKTLHRAFDLGEPELLAGVDIDKWLENMQEGYSYAVESKDRYEISNVAAKIFDNRSNIDTPDEVVVDTMTKALLELSAYGIGAPFVMSFLEKMRLSFFPIETQIEIFTNLLDKLQQISDIHLSYIFAASSDGLLRNGLWDYQSFRDFLLVGNLPAYTSRFLQRSNSYIGDEKSESNNGFLGKVAIGKTIQRGVISLIEKLPSDNLQDTLNLDDIKVILNSIAHFKLDEANKENRLQIHKIVDSILYDASQKQKSTKFIEKIDSLVLADFRMSFREFVIKISHIPSSHDAAKSVAIYVQTGLAEFADDDDKEIVLNAVRERMVNDEYFRDYLNDELGNHKLIGSAV